jgi:HAD superfamily hydrolase (TIGR01484 family)
MKQLKSIKYKALMSDIDGTLILNSPHANPSENVISAVKKASKLIHIGVATSRPYQHAERIINMLDLSAPCIVGGGAQIVDPKTKKVIWEKRLKRKQIKELTDEITAMNLKVELLDDENNIVDKNYSKKDLIQVWMPGQSLEDTEKVRNVVSVIKTIAINKVPSYQKGKFALVITDIHATKQHGILEIAKILNIKTKDIIGIGDGGNDFPLLMACGLKVAIGNAVPELKEIADYIAPPVEEDGIVDVIEKFVINERL